LRLHPEAVVLAAIAADPVAIANGHVEHRVRAEEDPAREVASGLPGVRDKDLLDVLELAAIQTPTSDSQCESTVALLRIGHVDQPVLRELRVDGHKVECVATLA